LSGRLEGGHDLGVDAGDQQHRRATAAGLGVQDGAVGLHLLDVDEGGGLGHGTGPLKSSNRMLR
jgi:hypothetical protein